MIQMVKAQEGKVFRRIHDGFVMGNEIHLGYDHSTGVKRPDLPEYYEMIDTPTEEAEEVCDGDPETE